MRKIISILGIGFALLMVSCAVNPPEDEIQSTLPDPDVIKVIVQSTPTTPFGRHGIGSPGIIWAPVVEGDSRGWQSFWHVRFDNAATPIEDVSQTL